MSFIERTMLSGLTLTVPVVGILGLLAAYQIYTDLMTKPEGNDRMKEISGAIREGAVAFLRAEAQYLAVFVIIVFFLISFSLGLATGIAYVLGSLSSLLAGYLGMKSATIANVRTANAASQNDAKEAFLIAFRGGAVMGLAVASLGLIGLGVLFWIYGSPHMFEPIVGFGVGASSVALFARVGGGIYTKAADVGSDLVGKVEAGIPEDDPRNPGVIADNVGDNVGDVAGMGADIYESYVAAIIGCMALAATASEPTLRQLTSIGSLNSPEAFRFYRIWLMMTPIAMALIGAFSSYAGIIGVYRFKDKDAADAIRYITIFTSVLFMALSLVFFLFTPVSLELWLTILVGTICGVSIGLLAEYYTSSKPVYEIVNAAKTGPATCIISGIAVGFNSAIFPMLVIALATFLSHYFGGLYGVALAGVSMLATVGITMTIDAYGPIADNAGGISEMSHLGKETRAITDRLDAIGNTTAAIGKGFASGSAGLAALSLFGAYAQSFSATGRPLDLTITNSLLVTGVFIGAVLPAVVVSSTMRSVGRAAGLIVEEIRRQFREIPGLLEGREGVKPDVSKCVEISTKAALSQMIFPGVIAILTPVLVGNLLGPEAVAGLLLGTTVVGVLIAIFMANAGGAWDNAKKFIEQGMVPGESKGTDTHKAAVVGDTVGDPFKDTSGPSLNILVKMVSVLALLIAPLL